MTEYVYIVDEQGCLQFINPAVEAFENLTNSEVKGKHIKELYTQGESPTLKALYEQKTIPEHENIYMLDGKQYHQLAKSFPLFAGDKLLGVCTVQRDMTLVSQVLSDNTCLLYTSHLVFHYDLLRYASHRHSVHPHDGRRG